MIPAMNCVNNLVYISDDIFKEEWWSSFLWMIGYIIAADVDEYLEEVDADFSCLYFS